MSARPNRDGAAVVGVGVAACVACCVGPILAALGAIGLGTVVGVFLFGVAGLAIAAVGLAVLVHRRRITLTSISPDVPVPVEISIRTPR